MRPRHAERQAARQAANAALCGLPLAGYPTVADVIPLLRPTRTHADLTLDLPHCDTTWTPRTCRGYDQRSPVDHRCWTWTGWPHICRCMRCGSTRG